MFSAVCFRKGNSFITTTQRGVRVDRIRWYSVDDAKWATKQDITRQWILTYYDIFIFTDKELPIISDMPSDITLPTANGMAYATVSWTEPTASDYYGVHNTLLSFTSSHTPGTNFLIGETPVTYTAVDLAGNNNTQIFSVTINGENIIRINNIN